MDIGIIGGGSLGLLLTSYLSKNHQVSLYVRRKEQASALKSDGILLYYENSRHETKNFNVELISNLRDHDLIFITVKQTHMTEVLSYINILNPATPLSFVQNGMGHIEKIRGLPNPIYIGVVEHGANRNSDTEVTHSGVGIIRLASFQKSHEIKGLQALASRLATDRFPVIATEAWEPILHKKLLINAVINPLTAIFDVPNGAIIKNTHMKRIAQELTREAAKILQTDFAKAWEEVARVASNTKHNVSSMRADLLNNRQTEIQAISGYLLEKTGRENLPYTSFAYEAILALEERGKK